MQVIELPGCDRLAWDGPDLYAANAVGEYLRLLPAPERLFSGKALNFYTHRSFVARGGGFLVSRLFRPDDDLAQLHGLLSHPTPAGDWPGDDGTTPDDFLGGAFYRRPDGVFVRLDPQARFALPYGSSQALLLQDSGVRLAGLAGGAGSSAAFVHERAGVRVPFGPDRPIRRFLADPRGGCLAFQEGGRLLALRIEGWNAVLRPALTLRRRKRDPVHCAVSADRVLYNLGGDRVLLVSRSDADVVGEGPLGPGSALAFSPDGRLIGLSGRAGLLLCRGSDLAVEREYRVPGGPVRHIAFSPDGLVVAAVTLGGVTIFDLD
jgi:hypothetical protein